MRLNKYQVIVLFSLRLIIIYLSVLTTALTKSKNVTPTLLWGEKEKILNNIDDILEIERYGDQS